MFLIYILLVAIEGATCTGDDSARYFCSTKTPCDCPPAAGGAQAVICLSPKPATLFGLSTFLTGKIAASGGACSLDPAAKIFFPGEVITEHDATHNFCTKHSRQFVNDKGNGLDTNLLITSQQANYAPTVSAASVNKYCSINSTNSAPLEVAAATVIAHGGNGDLTNKDCISLTYVNARKNEDCTDSANTCDRHLDVANSAASDLDTLSCTPNTRLIQAGSKATVTKLRCVALSAQIDALDIASAECTYDAADASNTKWCNPGANATSGGKTVADERCVPDTERLGTGTTIGGSILAVGAAGANASSDKICIGKKYWTRCVSAAGDTQEVCNPYAQNKDNICLLKKDVIMDHTAHGKTGIEATPVWCVPHTLDADFERTTAVEKKCLKTEVCNKASTTPDETCLLKTHLIGEIAAGADWTHLGQLRKPGKKVDANNDQWCFAKVTPTSGVLYFTKRCVSAAGTADTPTKQICNPNAKALAEVCVLEHNTLQHGETATKDKFIVIGDDVYNMSCKFESGKEEVANWGATLEADACINKKEILNNTDPLKAFRIDAAKASTTAKPLMYCMSKIQAGGKNGAVQCKVDADNTDKDESEVCNPHGEKGGAADTDAALCVTKSKVLAQGVVVTTKMVTDGEVLCIGTNGKGTCAENEACDLGSGTCIIAKGETSKLLAPYAVAEEGKVECFGSNIMQTCELGYICNPNGTTKDEKVTKIEDAKATSVCWFADALHTAPSGTICLTYEEDAEKKLVNSISATLCEEDAPYCGDDGVCTAEVGETSATPDDGLEEVEGVEGVDADYAATKSIWIGVAIAATLL